MVEYVFAQHHHERRPTQDVDQNEAAHNHDAHVGQKDLEKLCGRVHELLDGGVAWRRSATVVDKDILEDGLIDFELLVVQSGDDGEDDIQRTNER